MGGGVLPTTIHNGKLYFLFGKEGQYEDTARGFSDFGGGTDNNEKLIETAAREGSEELTGFLGDRAEIYKMLRSHGTYNIDYKDKDTKFDTYRTHIFPFQYNYFLPHYYNNNQRFLQKKLSPEIFKTTTIFEKIEIRWVSIDELKEMRPKFRFWYRNIVDKILAEKQQIISFIKKSMKKKTIKNRTKKNRTKKSKTKWFIF